MRQSGASGGLPEAVYRVVAGIPAGCVATYGQIAILLGCPRAARIVGGILSRAPGEEKLPCHRVVNRYGGLAPGDVFGGAGLQRMLLESEGVAFLPDGRVDLGKHIIESGRLKERLYEE